MAFVTGILAFPFLTTKHSVSGKYSLEVTQLDDNTVKELEELGVNVKEHEDKGRFIQAKSGFVPTVKDSKGNEVPFDIVRTIGTGSTVALPMKTYQTTYQKQTFENVKLGTVFLHKLVKYEALPDFEEDGFVVSEAPKVAEEMDDEIPFN